MSRDHRDRRESADSKFIFEFGAFNDRTAFAESGADESQLSAFQPVR